MTCPVRFTHKAERTRQGKQTKLNKMKKLTATEIKNEIKKARKQMKNAEQRFLIDRNIIALNSAIVEAINTLENIINPEELTN